MATYRVHIGAAHGFTEDNGLPLFKRIVTDRTVIFFQGLLIAFGGILIVSFGCIQEDFFELLVLISTVQLIYVFVDGRLTEEIRAA